MPTIRNILDGSSLRRDIAPGRKAFIWRCGVLRFGLLFAVATALQDEFWQGEHLFEPAWLSVLVRVVLYVLLLAPLAGAGWGWMMWPLVAPRAEPGAEPPRRDT